MTMRRILPMLALSSMSIALTARTIDAIRSELARAR